MFTCNLGGYAGSDRRTKALVGRCFKGEEVGGSRVQPNKQMVGLIPLLENLSPLSCQISTGVQGAQCLIGNLEVDGKILHLNALT